MGKRKLAGKPRVMPLTGSPDRCPQCELEVDSGKLEEARDVSVQYDVQFGKSTISFFRCDEHDTYETNQGMKTMKDSLVYTYGDFIKFRGVVGPKIPDHVLKVHQKEEKRLKESSKSLIEYGDEIAEKSIALERDKERLKKREEGITKSEAELAFKEIDITYKQEQAKDEEESKAQVREERLRTMLGNITSGEGAEDQETEAIRVEAGLAPNYTFEHYAEFESNRFTCTAAKAVAQNPANAYNPFIVHGPPGTGKTHLLQAIAYEIKRSNPESRIKYVSTGKMKDRFLKAMADNTIGEFIEDYEAADVLIMDDAQYLKDSAGLQERFAVIFTDMFNDRKQILINFDKPPEEIPELDERLRSRFEGGLVREMGRLTPDEKGIVLRTILEKKYPGLDVSPDMLLSLASHAGYNNIRALNGALDSIHNYQTTLMASGDEPMADAELCKELDIAYKIFSEPEKTKVRPPPGVEESKIKKPPGSEEPKIQKPPGPGESRIRKPPGMERSRVRKPPGLEGSETKEPSDDGLKSLLERAKGLKGSAESIEIKKADEGKGKPKK